MIVRAGGAADAAGIARVHVETWRAAYAGMLPDDYLIGLSATRRAAHWANVLTGRTPERVFVAEEDGAVVGFASCGPARRCAALKTRKSDGEVYTLYVLHDYQGIGLGRQLLASAFERLAENGCGAAVVWVLQSNPSRFFYEAMGGVALGEREEKFAGAMVTEVAYGWEPLALSVMKRVEGK